METQKARVLRMQGRSTAINILEADGDGAGTFTAVGIYRDAIPASAWKRPTPYLSAAVRRAFSWRYVVAKRTLDILLSSLLILIFFPVMLAVAIAVALTSPGPIFFTQERMGRFGAPFRILKFRSMFTQKQKHKDNVFEINGQHRRSEADTRNEAAYPLNKDTPDPRITPVGRIIRKLSLDELPQLFNVLLGDMSLVGPRPIVEAEVPLYGQEFAYYDLFRPGITGLWQVSGRSDVGFEKRVGFDREYASEWSCLLDFKILTMTIPAVVTMRGAY
jgi:lipopolysaccharide/colanic/teichoic acid biosynthesis glycosyltransferase